ncbi:hypothetical protein [Streptomyces sp. NPDC058548]|uniref:hypothetical protein n=1 Tax=unclassified Streptomyces TaxID=2593676 RepID=UPI003662430F
MTKAIEAPIDLLCLDEFGYLNLDRKCAKLLLRRFTEREERKATQDSPFPHPSV